MDEKRASITALVTAYFRAYHATHDFPKIFDDSLADELYTADEHTSFDQNLAGMLKIIDPERAVTVPDQATALAIVMQVHNGPITLSRSRFSEDCLERAVEQGVRQYMILGAGLDTFAFRRPELSARLQIFELDHPATQSVKQERLRLLKRDTPAQLHFVLVDFTQKNLKTALSESSYDPKKLSLFSWLGVTYYLTQKIVFATLAAISELAPSGSSITFDFLDPDAFIPGMVSRRVQLMRDRARMVGEPMISGFDPHTLAEELEYRGLDLKENLSPMEIEGLYFRERSDEYHAFEHVHFARATVI